MILVVVVVVVVAAAAENVHATGKTIFFSELLACPLSNTTSPPLYYDKEAAFMRIELMLKAFYSEHGRLFCKLCSYDVSSAVVG